MIQLMLVSAASGGGKTMMTCALLRALSRRGLSPCAFKCGPDYIDPMYHRAALGAESRNLDLFLSDEGTLRLLYARHVRGRGAAVCEGVMGYYDGLGGVSDAASSYHVARTLGIPALLVLRPGGSALTLAAQLRGLIGFRQPSCLAGILLSDCSPSLCRSLGPMLEKETGLPVLGCLPRLPEAQIASRHLGLLTAAETADLQARFDRLADALEENADIDRLLALCEYPAPDCAEPAAPPPVRARIAVARDEAFCFAYDETFEALRLCGAEAVPFSPLRDEKLPSGVGGLYLPGGYPELHARQLAENLSMRESVRAAVRNGLPAVAECGGFLYLGQALRDAEGKAWPMAGCLPGEGAQRKSLVRFGYARMTAEKDGLLLNKGQSVPVHSFHRWDSDQIGEDFSLEKPLTGRAWREGVSTPTLHAAFPHLYFAGSPALAERFADRAEEAGR